MPASTELGWVKHDGGQPDHKLRHVPDRRLIQTRGRGESQTKYFSTNTQIDTEKK